MTWVIASRSDNGPTVAHLLAAHEQRPDLFTDWITEIYNAQTVLVVIDPTEHDAAVRAYRRQLLRAFRNPANNHRAAADIAYAVFADMWTGDHPPIRPCLGVHGQPCGVLSSWPRCAEHGTWLAASEAATG